MPAILIKTLPGQDGERRIAIVQDAGLYRLEHQYRYRNIDNGLLIAEGWASLPGTISYYGDAVSAERAARAEYPWLA